MREKPILFQTAMVCALLAGTKTQTRRALKIQPLDIIPMNDDLAGREWVTLLTRDPEPKGGVMRCRFGQPGDRLWVRESHWWFKDEHDPVTGYFPPKLTADDVEYRADGEVPGRIWRPSIHMHRWASRILLEITTVRVERLQEISEEDALAEGVLAVQCNDLGTEVPYYRSLYEPRDLYRMLWSSINGPGSWGANPWVWCISFRRIS